MDKKILFTDLDGTLLDDDKNIRDMDLEAIDRMVKCGHKFVISTGRPIQSVVKISDRYGWHLPGYYISSYNGGLIYDCGTKKAIIRHPLSKEYVRYIFDRAYEAGFHAHSYDDEYVVSERDNIEVRQYSDKIKVPYIVVDDILSYLKDDPIKVIVISHESRQKLEQFREMMEPWCADRIATVFSSPILLEFSAPESTKGNAVKFMCSHFDIPLSDSIAIGDEENDITMIEAAGLGVAMNNATDPVKRTADIITENDNNNGGIAEIINKYILST